MVPKLRTFDVEHSHMGDIPTSLFQNVGASLCTLQCAKLYEQGGLTAQLPTSGGKCVFARLLAKQLTKG